MFCSFSLLISLRIIRAQSGCSNCWALCTSSFRRAPLRKSHHLIPFNRHVRGDNTVPDDELGKKEEKKMWKPHVHQPLDSCFMLDKHTLTKMHPYLCAGFDRYTDAGINLRTIYCNWTSMMQLCLTCCEHSPCTSVTFYFLFFFGLLVVYTFLMPKNFPLNVVVPIRPILADIWADLQAISECIIILPNTPFQVFPLLHVCLHVNIPWPTAAANYCFFLLTPWPAVVTPVTQNAASWLAFIILWEFLIINLAAAVPRGGSR